MSLFQSTDHVGFTVSNLDEAVSYYTEILGGPDALVSRKLYAGYVASVLGYPGLRQDSAFLRLPGGDMLLQLVQYPDRPGHRVNMDVFNVGNAHLSLNTDDIERTFARLVAIGFVPRSEGLVDMVEDEGAPWDKYQGGKAAMFRDPDDIGLSVHELP